MTREVESGQALCRCGNWSEFVDLQQDWARQTTEEYLGEARRIIELASTVAKDNWEPVYVRPNHTLTTLGKREN